jgi:hypothetical protein
MAERTGIAGLEPQRTTGGIRVANYFPPWDAHRKVLLAPIPAKIKYTSKNVRQFILQSWQTHPLFPILYAFNLPEV